MLLSVCVCMENKNKSSIEKKLLFRVHYQKEKKTETCLAKRCANWGALI